MRAERALALVLLLACGPLAAAELGTLFHTADERARLDRLRRGDPVASASAQAVARPSKPEVTGFVRRSDGRNTVWIDGQPVATSNPKNAPLYDPRLVRDLDSPLPPSAIRVSPESKAGTSK